MGTRGELTGEIQLLAEFHMDRQISRTELRLMAYVDYTMKNSQKINPQHLNGEDRKVLQQWREEGYIEGGASGLAITREFYDIMQHILWEGYVVGGANTYNKMSA